MDGNKNAKGKVYLIGAGPGDPELITLKGERLLKNCEAVVYDRLIPESLLYLVPENCEKIDVGKTPGGISVPQEDINRILVRKAEDGKKVVRLKGGDPFVFGRGGEEILALQKAGIDFEVVPGISSSLSAPALAGIPVTHRNVSRSFHVITGHRDKEEEDWDFKNLAKVEGTLIFLMGMESIKTITEELIKEGKDSNTPAAVISNAARDNQITVRGTLGTISKIASGRNIKAPAVIVIGETAAYRFLSGRKGSLSGVRIGITGTESFVRKLSDALREEDAAVINFGFLTVKKHTKSLEFKELISRLFEYTWLIFTSSNGVQIFFDALKEEKIDFRRLAAFKIAAVGQGTADAIASFGFTPDYVSEKGNGGALAGELLPFLTEQDRLLLLRAGNASGDMTIVLKNNHVVFEDFPLYSLVPEEYKKQRVLKEISDADYLIFASSLGVKEFYHELPENLKRSIKAKLVCMGEATRDRLKALGNKEILQAEKTSIASLVQTVVRDYAVNKEDAE